MRHSQLSAIYIVLGIGFGSPLHLVALSQVDHEHLLAGHIHEVLYRG